MTREDARQEERAFDNSVARAVIIGAAVILALSVAFAFGWHA